MLSHSFDKLYVVMKFVLPMVEDLKFLTIQFDSSCSYLDIGLNRSKHLTDYTPNIKNYWKKIIPFVASSKKQIEYYNCTTHEILTKEISLILMTFSKERKQKEVLLHHLLLVLLIWHMKLYLAFYIINDARHYTKKHKETQRNTKHLGNEK